MSLHHPNKSPSDQTGFTLLEILIALFIFAILAVITSTALYHAFAVHKRFHKALNQISNIATSTTLLQRDISQMVNRKIRVVHGEEMAAFIAKPQGIRFTRMGYVNPLALAKRSTLQRVSYYVENGNLTRQTWSTLHRTTKTQTQQQVLLQHIATVQFKFLGKGTTFYAYWPVANFIKENAKGKKTIPLPRAIQIKLTFTNQQTLNLIFAVPTSELNV